MNVYIYICKYILTEMYINRLALHIYFSLLKYIGNKEEWQQLLL